MCVVMDARRKALAPSSALRHHAARSHGCGHSGRRVLFPQRPVRRARAALTSFACTLQAEVGRVRVRVGRERKVTGAARSSCLEYTRGCVGACVRTRPSWARLCLGRSGYSDYADAAYASDGGESAYDPLFSFD
jgi:hypothetical protein